MMIKNLASRSLAGFNLIYCLTVFFRNEFPNGGHKT